MSAHDLLPLLRGALLASTGTPVVLLPAEGEPDHVLEISADDSTSLADSVAWTLPAVTPTVRVTCSPAPRRLLRK